MKKKLENSLAWVRERIKTLTETANSLSGDDRSTVENTIAKLKEQEETLVNAIAMCDNAADLAAVRTQVEEVQNAVKAIRETMKGAKKTANTLAEMAKTKAFREAFVETVRNTVEPREFKAAWRAKVNELMTKNSIDGDNITESEFNGALKFTVQNEAGKYLDKDGNGDVKLYYEEHLKPYDKILKGA